MNSEELEQSLRSEFENYLTSVITELRGDLAELQRNIESELDKQREQVNSAINGFAARLDAGPQFDAGFSESVVEHLRLARDEGAKITAAAIAEAEELERKNTPEANYSDIREAVEDISSKDSQSAILKALVSHASKFTPRGAFFIIKNEHFVGWKVFGGNASDDETSVRDIHFPVSDDSILGRAVAGLATVEGAFGSYSADSQFLDPLNFGRPDRMYAIPLVARGRGVAVLYADYGNEGVSLDTDALETLVKVAALTVELLATAKTAQMAAGTGAEAANFEDASHDDTPSIASSGYEYTYTPEPAVETVEDTPAESFNYESTFRVQDTVVEPAYTDISGAQAETTPVTDLSFENTVPIDGFEPAAEYAAPQFETERSFADFDPASIPEVTNADALTTEPAIVFEQPEFSTVSEPETSFEFKTENDANPYEASPFDQAAEPVAEPVPAPEPVSVPEPVEVKEEQPAAASNQTRTRLSDRQIDLPVEVADDERRLHNDARRFARLLVSEIKLYNDKKVQEGRENSDLYQRLQEAIDRSREMYDKRIQPPVAAKFDYFHYELVSSLAEGDETRLGSGYPGASV